MTTYLVQYRLVKLPDHDAEPDRWSSATSTMTVVEASAPIDCVTDDEAAAMAVARVRELAEGLVNGRPMLEAAEAMAREAPKSGPPGAVTGYRQLDEAMVAEALVMDEVYVAAAVIDGQPAISVLFRKDNTAMPGLVLTGKNASDMPDLCRQALAGAKEYVREHHL